MIFDVSDLANPFVAGTFTAGGEAIDHNLYCHEGRIYEADYTEGLRIYDATQDPLNPTPVGAFDTLPGTGAAEFSGAWSVYPFFPSGNMLISTKSEGLFIVRPGPAPLVFDFVNEPPTRIHPGGDTVVVNITEQDGQQLLIGSPTLHYDAGAGMVEAPMTDLGGGLYEGAFGTTPCGQLVRYFVSATTISNITMTDPADAPSAMHDVASAFASTVVLDDDMETDQGWVAGVSGDTAVTGVWLRIEPNGTPAQPQADHTAEPAELCYVTGQGNPNGLAGDADVDEGHTTLLSPVFDLSGAEDAIVSYWRWYSNDWEQFDGDEGQAPNEDVFVIDITNDNGASWCNLETIGPAGPGTSGGWFLAYFNVADHVEPTGEVRLRFVASDVNGFSVVEAGVDDVTVEIVECDVLTGDVNGDGSVDFADVLALIGGWGACADCGDCPADVNGDCSVNFADILVIIANWG
ncbi:MAG: choice-of-anchor B family protein [Planctomycetes bacterium]|nr:choice-of-anchor B family protein [Planctomycetota bacterium]